MNHPQDSLYDVYKCLKQFNVFENRILIYTTQNRRSALLKLPEALESQQRWLDYSVMLCILQSSICLQFDFTQMTTGAVMVHVCDTGDSWS